MNRVLPLEGVENFRDFGGYAAGAGRLRRGLLYRSAHHARATDSDLEAMAALGIAVVVDLRRRRERDQDRCRRWPGFAAQVIENDEPDEHEEAWITFLQDSDLSEEAFRRHVTGYYRAAPFAPRHIDLYSRYFQALASARGPVLIHCAAGKDRTGILAALTHHIAGVATEDLVADYLLTNASGRLERRLPELISSIEEKTGRRPPEEAVRIALGVDASFLATTFAAMEDRYGSIDGYLARALGVDAPLRARIRRHIVATDAGLESPPGERAPGGPER